MSINLRRYPHYKESGVKWLGAIPEHWSVIPLKRLSNLENSGCYGVDQAEGEFQYPVATTAQIDADGHFDVERMPIRGFSKTEVNRYLCKPNDILVVKSSGSSSNIISGKAGIILSTTPEFVFSNFLLRLKPDQRKIHPKYLYLLLVSHLTRERIKRMVATTTYPNIQVDEYYSAALPLPDLDEQIQILRFLRPSIEGIERLIDEQQTFMELLKEKKQAIVSHAITRGLNPDALMKASRIDWIREIPAHWAIERTKWLFRERDERSKAGEEEMLTVSHLTGVTPRSEKNVNMFEAETNEGYKLCHAGDLVINTMWAWMGAMGVAPIFGMVSPAYNVYAPGKRILPSYIDSLVRMPLFAQEVVRYSKGVWTSRLRLYPEGFFQTFMPVPPIDEQKAIAKHIASESARIDSVIVAANRSIELLQERSAALISAAVTGQIDVRNYHPQEASAVCQ